MATVTESAGRRAFPRLHWGAVIAGVLLALATHVVLGLMGAALGFAAAPSNSRAVGAAAAIWALVTPFVAALLGAWLACRMAAAEDSRSASLHGILVWSIGLIAGALFLAASAATGAMTAGIAASGNLGAVQRTARAEAGGRAPGPAAARGGEDAGKAAAAGAGAGALAAIAGLLGAFVGAGIAQQRIGARRGRGFWIGKWRLERHEEASARGDRGRGAGTTYGTQPHLPESEIPPPTDPYHH
jgi:hypothetical protein